MTEDVSFGSMDEAASTIYPEGETRTCEKLMQQFESQTNVSRVKLMRHLASFKLRKSHQDIDPYISGLELMRIRLKKMGSDIGDEYLIMHTMKTYQLHMID